ncbi:MAG: hypothetical protein HQL77_07315 [Magnetococcales bacterium]|nr:hypothetical protein [Magnetococcales bacterium]
MSALTALELDMLAEAFNIGLGLGSSALSELLGEEIHVSVPGVKVLPKRPAIDECAQRYDTRAHTIRQAFIDAKGASAFSGDAFLFVPQPSSQVLTELLSNSEVTEAEVLAELGNLILHSCLGSLANMMETELDSELPEVHLNRSAELLIEIARNKNRGKACEAGSETVAKETKRRPLDLQDKVLQLEVQFKTLEKNISGEIMLFLDLSRLPDLKIRIRDAIHRLTVP